MIFSKMAELLLSPWMSNLSCTDLLLIFLLVSMEAAPDKSLALLSKRWVSVSDTLYDSYFLHGKTPLLSLSSLLSITSVEKFLCGRSFLPVFSANGEI